MAKAGQRGLMAATHKRLADALRDDALRVFEVGTPQQSH
jgi:hypothetical protein